MERISWNEYFLNFAESASLRSTCPRLSVGAVIVKDHKIIGTGYNGVPSGISHCSEVGCLIENEKCIASVHAEVNAIIKAEQNLQNTEIFVSHHPCFQCAKLIINSGITAITYSKEYKSDEARALLLKAGYTFGEKHYYKEAIEL